MADEYDPTDGRNRVPLGTDTKTRAPVYLPYADRDLGVAIIGKSGTGKSSLFEHMILADLENGTPGMAIDPHGRLAQHVIELATPKQASRIILLEAVLSAPFGLNLLALRSPVDEDDYPASWAVDSVVATIKKLYGEDDEFLPRLEHYMELAAHTLIANGRTLADTPRLFRNDEFRHRCLTRVIDLDVLDDWSQYESLRKTDQVTHSEAVINRLSGMLRHPMIKSIVGSPETTVPFDEILSGDKMLIVSLPSNRLSPERCDFIGAMLLCALADRIFVRNVSVAKPPRLHIYLDEYQRFATSTTAELLEQGRKYGAGVTLAHQTLYQIKDQRIRNAARHAGTLIVLGVTHPDAEQLAGEFPITPKPEWVEEIEETDGTEPKYVHSPTPAEDIYMEKHSSDDVDLASRTLFSYYPPYERTEQVFSIHQPEPRIMHTGRQHMGRTFIDPSPRLRYISDDKRKSAGVHPRPGGAPFPEHLKLSAPDLNHLLSDAQEGKLTAPEDAADAILAAGIFRLAANSAGWLDKNVKPSPWGYEAERARFTKVFEQRRDEFLQACLRPWIRTHLYHPEDLLGGRYTRDLKDADALFAREAFHRRWDHSLNWNGATDKETGKLGRGPATVLTIGSGGVTLSDPSGDPAMLGMLAERRQQLRWIWILCDGLRRDPVMMRSVDHQPRITRRHIVHSGQTHADALNEFAGKLVHPPQRYVAHVRQPQEYHQVKLRRPLGGEAGDGVRSPNPDQPDDIRARSRELYDTSADQASVLPLLPPKLPQRRRVTRSPQTRDADADRNER